MEPEARAIARRLRRRRQQRPEPPASGPVRVPRVATGTRAMAARKTPCSSSCRCSSRCRTPTAHTNPRSRRCTTCCRRRWSTSSRPMGTDGTAPIVGKTRQHAANPRARRLQPASRRSGMRPPRHDEPKDSTPVVRPIEQEANVIPRIDRSPVGRWHGTVGSWKLGVGTSTRTMRIGSNNWAISGRLTDDGSAARRQRHAPGHARAEHVVSRLARVAATAAEPSARIAWSASRCPVFPRWSSAATRTSPGVSPTRYARLERPHPARSRSARSESLSHAGRLAAVRPLRRDDRSRGREPRT